MIRLAIIGDFDRGVTAHEAIDASLARVQQTTWPDLSWEWWHTGLLPEHHQRVAEVIGVPDGVWCVPASPYAKTEGALAAIRYARESDTPFLGTCGGFQHAVMEFVRNVLGDPNADHAELNPTAGTLAITPLTCDLVEVSGSVTAVEGTRFQALYAGGHEREEYHCRYGLNAQYLERMEARGFRCGARDEQGEVRALDLVTHSFFVATLFQPERRALRVGATVAAGTGGGGAGAAADAGEVHPIVLQFVESASNRRMRRVRAGA